MRTVGITGGIGSGKTTVCRMLETLGVPVFYADTEAARLQNEDPEVVQRIKDAFGEEIYVNGQLDRKALAKIVFKDAAKLKALTSIVHPAVHKAFQEWSERQQAPYSIREAAVMIESGSHRDLDALIVVHAPEDTRVRRVVKRDGSDEESVRARMARQLSENERLSHADHVIDNSGEILLLPQVLKLHRNLIEYESTQHRTDTNA